MLSSFNDEGAKRTFAHLYCGLPYFSMFVPGHQVGREKDQKLPVIVRAE